MGRKLLLSIILALIVAVVPGVSVLAASTDANAPVVLGNEEPVGDMLAGAQNGAFHYYAIEYAGDESIVTFTMRFSPADPVVSAAVGFNVYGPNGFHIGQGAPVDPPEAGVLELRYADQTPATWVVQVFNYLPNVAISYQIEAEGVREPQAEEAAPAEEEATPEASAFDETATGTLAGLTVGSFAQYAITADTDDDITINLMLSSDNPVIRQGAGFVVYGPAGEVARGVPTGDPGERVATFTPVAGEPYTLQVYNYLEGLTLDYTISRSTGQ
ncbi:MAG: hypothetical protein ACYC5M_07365 [Anaerolineae bacterium]